MKLQFDPNQTFQLDAVAAITDLFDGQPQSAPEYAVISVDAWGGLFAGQERTELGAGNRRRLDADKLLANTRAIQTRGIRLRRDSWVSVRYHEELNSAKSSVTLLRTDRHEILGQKPPDFQLSLCECHPERATPCPADGPVQEQCASSPAGHRAPQQLPGILVMGNRRRPAVGHPLGGRHALHLRAQAWRGDGHDERVFCASPS